mmetsp:Transcript_25676/g.58623  ORF Transcript_25676/g.58623 Transcript_25676/m.58623 type:complete len:267 (+) Transcript_25676:28-828(+)
MLLKKALSYAFGKTDREVVVDLRLSDGSTAVVMAVTPRHIVVGNAGDSRAIVLDGKQAIPLSIDCKPSRPDEQRRIEAAGGHVMHLGVPRVNGILAVSRAIGDAELKHVVTSEPEIRSVRRSPTQWAAVLASDGLWDVLTCEEVRAITEANFGQEGHGAQQLCQEAFNRGSFDNICAMVVDLRAIDQGVPSIDQGEPSSSSDVEEPPDSNGSTSSLKGDLDGGIAAGYVLPVDNSEPDKLENMDEYDDRGWAHTDDYHSSEEVDAF